MVKNFTGKNIEQCIDFASNELHMDKGSIKYKVIDEKRSFLKKSITIEVEIDNEPNKTNDDKRNGLVEITDGKIKVTNPKEGGIPACIRVSEDLAVLVDGIKVIGKKKVFENNKIDVIFPESTSRRVLNIDTDSDKMKAYITIKYKPMNIFILEDVQKNNVIDLKSKILKSMYPTQYSEDEIKVELMKSKISYGISADTLRLCASSREIENMVIAQGIKPVDDTDDALKLNFENKNLTNKAVDDNQKIDYRDKNSIIKVKKGEIIAEKFPGTDGSDGMNIYGKAVKRKIGKRTKLKVADGCMIQGNKIIALIDGRPEYRNGVFLVNSVYEIYKDVDLKTGNIDFIGDVIVHGNITEGMKIKSKASTIIYGNVTNANITSKYDINLKKNVILSHICAGGNDVRVLKNIEYLEKISSYITEIIMAVKQITEKQLLGKKYKVGEILKILLENKYKNIPKLYVDLASTLNNSVDENDILTLIKAKLLGLGPINVKEASEIEMIKVKIEERINKLKTIVSIPANVNMEYCQDSKIESTGNIIITGKGEYASKITSNDSIKFMLAQSVARGGILKAKNKIECSVAGSPGQVITKLIVEKQGHIKIKKAYANTILYLGQIEHNLDTCCKNVHAYINKDGELQVDKIRL